MTQGTSGSAGSAGAPRSPKQRFGALLWRLAELEAADATRRSYRARAYANAVWALDRLAPDLGHTREEVLAVPWLGKGVAALIAEFEELGTIRRLEALSAALPREAGRLARLPRMTPARLRRLKSELGVEDRAGLAEAIGAGRLEGMPGVGAGTAHVWQQRLALIGGEPMPVLRAAAYGRRWAAHIQHHVGGCTVAVSGAVRRLEEHVDVIDLVVTGGEALASFLAGSALTRGLTTEGATHRMNTLGGELAVHAVSPETAGTVLVQSTGPPEHLAFLLRSAGVATLPMASREEEVYHTIGLPPVPPPARTGELPPRDLVLVEELRGDLHLHSDWSPDGRQSLAGMVEAAADRGFDYVAITDHAAGLRFGGLTHEALRRQRGVVEQLRERFPDLLILHGAELNIARDGSLDYDDEVLAWLDFRLAAVHSHFDLDPQEQTQRLLQAIHHPLVHAVAHPSGRRIGVRPPIRFDAEAVFSAAARTSTALEVNGHLDRLDLSAGHCRLASSLGVRFLADSDAHRADEWENSSNAAGVLQRAGVLALQVVNTWKRGELTRWLAPGNGHGPPQAV